MLCAWVFVDAIGGQSEIALSNIGCCAQISFPNWIRKSQIRFTFKLNVKRINVYSPSHFTLIFSRDHYQWHLHDHEWCWGNDHMCMWSSCHKAWCGIILLPPQLCVCVSANVHLPQYISFSPHAFPMLMVKSLMVDGHRWANRTTCPRAQCQIRDRLAELIQHRCKCIRTK